MLGKIYNFAGTWRKNIFNIVGPCGIGGIITFSATNQRKDPYQAYGGQKRTEKVAEITESPKYVRQLIDFLSFLLFPASDSIAAYSSM